MQIVGSLCCLLDSERDGKKDLDMEKNITEKNHRKLFFHFQCCMALGLLNFLDNDDIAVVLALMKNFETIFCGSFLKANTNFLTI